MFGTTLRNLVGLGAAAGHPAGDLITSNVSRAAVFASSVPTALPFGAGVIWSRPSSCPLQQENCQRPHVSVALCPTRFRAPSYVLVDPCWDRC